MLSYKFNIWFGQKKLDYLQCADNHENRRSFKKNLTWPHICLSLYESSVIHFNFIQYGCFTIDNLLQFTTYPFEPKQFPF